MNALKQHMGVHDVPLSKQPSTALEDSMNGVIERREPTTKVEIPKPVNHPLPVH